MLKTTQSALGKAEAFITFRRGRKKVYSNKFIYLNDQDEFEIELFNGLQEDTLVKITFSDSASSLNEKGLLIYPGQRIFLDRFLNKPNKFKFDTYKVENSNAAKHAIAKNGGIKIEFFTRASTWNLNSGTTTYFPPLNPYYNSGNFYCNTGGYSNLSSFTTSIGGTTTTTSTNVNDLSKSNSKSIETGKIAQGDKSNQNLVDVNDNSTWNFYATQTFDYQILPFSEKPLEIKDIKIYCSQCGTKLRSEWKFCANCSHKV